MQSLLCPRALAQWHRLHPMPGWHHAYCFCPHISDTPRTISPVCCNQPMQCHSGPTLCVRPCQEAPWQPAKLPGPQAHNPVSVPPLPVAVLVHSTYTHPFTLTHICPTPHTAMRGSAFNALITAAGRQSWRCPGSSSGTAWPSLPLEPEQPLCRLLLWVHCCCLLAPFPGPAG